MDADRGLVGWPADAADRAHLADAPELAAELAEELAEELVSQLAVELAAELAAAELIA